MTKEELEKLEQLLANGVGLHQPSYMYISISVRRGGKPFIVATELIGELKGSVVFAKSHIEADRICRSMFNYKPKIVYVLKVGENGWQSFAGVDYDRLTVSI